MTPEEVARFLKKSASWVYKHWQELGGVKLGGSLFFPHKEDLYERIFRQGQRVPVRPTAVVIFYESSLDLLYRAVSLRPPCQGRSEDSVSGAGYSAG